MSSERSRDSRDARSSASSTGHGTLLVYAWSSRALVVAAFLSDAVATQSGYEIAGFVPLREQARLVPDFRFDTSASTNLASTALRGARSLAGGC